MSKRDPLCNRGLSTLASPKIFLRFKFHLRPTRASRSSAGYDRIHCNALFHLSETAAHIRNQTLTHGDPQNVPAIVATKIAIATGAPVSG
jgi:hypothetical protein